MSASPWPTGHRFADRVRETHAAVHDLLAYPGGYGMVRAYLKPKRSGAQPAGPKPPREHLGADVRRLQAASRQEPGQCGCQEAPGPGTQRSRKRRRGPYPCESHTRLLMLCHRLAASSSSTAV